MKLSRKLAIAAAAMLLALMFDPLLAAAAQVDPHAHAGHHYGAGQTMDQEILYFIVRIAYYAGLLALSGLLFWRVLRGAFPIVEETREKAISLAGKYMLLAVLVYIFLNMMSLAQGEPLAIWLQILMETKVGRQYAGILLLGLAAPLLPHAGKLFGWGWAVLILALESWSGHASAYSPAAYTVGLDFIHLLASAVWAGGLVLLFAVWWKARYEAGRFARVFSRFALVSFAVLWITGFLNMLAFLPSLEYLVYTTWGKWLMAKIAATLLVIVVALFIRRQLRRKHTISGWLLQADLGLLAVIVMVAGIFTYMSPLPQNEPLYYHKMGSDMHLTLRITPNEPGENQFIVKVWLPEEDGAPRQVQLFLSPAGKESGAAEVPLAPYQDQEFDVFEGFAKYTYQSEGPYLSSAGEWKAAVTVVDSSGKERVTETTFRVY
jgi:copper transport protein